MPVLGPDAQTASAAAVFPRTARSAMTWSNTGSGAHFGGGRPLSTVRQFEVHSAHRRGGAAGEVEEAGSAVPLMLCPFVEVWHGRAPHAGRNLLRRRGRTGRRLLGPRWHLSRHPPHARRHVRVCCALLHCRWLANSASRRRKLDRFGGLTGPNGTCLPIQGQARVEARRDSQTRRHALS